MNNYVLKQAYFKVWEALNLINEWTDLKLSDEQKARNCLALTCDVLNELMYKYEGS